MIPGLENEVEDLAPADKAYLCVTKTCTERSTFLNILVYESRYLPVELFRKFSSRRKLDTAKIEKKST